MIRTAAVAILFTAFFFCGSSFVKVPGTGVLLQNTAGLHSVPLMIVQTSFIEDSLGGREKTGHARLSPVFSDVTVQTNRLALGSRRSFLPAESFQGFDPPLRI